MMAALFLGVTIGFLGSWHCVGMCGPLAMALPYRTTKPLPRLALSTLYTLGRTTTYIGVGMILATTGEFFSMAGLQRVLSVSVGLILIAIVLLPAINKKLEQAVYQTRLGRSVQKRIAKLYRNQNVATFYWVGLLNGLLPCGLVYMAAFAALGSARLAYGLSIMLGFGLGTWPLMTALAIFPIREWLSRVQGLKLSNVLMFVAGTLMIIRATTIELPDVPILGVFNPSHLTICK